MPRLFSFSCPATGHKDFKEPQAQPCRVYCMVESVEVVVPKNIRFFSDYDTDLEISAGRAVRVSERQLRALTLRYALLEGRLRVAKGTVTFPFKDSVIVIHGIPEGNTSIEYHHPERGVEVKTFDMETTAQKIAAAEKKKKKTIRKPGKRKPKKSRKRK